MPQEKSKPDQICDWLERLKLIGDCHGQPWKLEPFQREFIHAVYGPTDKDGRRKVRRALLYVPRGNGKSTLLAGFNAYHIAGEAKSHQKVYSAASSLEQAKIIYEYTVSMIEQVPYLRRNCKIIPHKNQIIFKPRNNVYESLSASHKRANGLAPSVVIADETHLWTGAAGRALWAGLSKGLGKRREPLLISISTAGNTSDCVLWDELKLARAALAEPDKYPYYVAHLYELTPEEAERWEDEDLWLKANPALAREGWYNVDTLRDTVAAAKLIPSELADFKQYNLNIWGAQSISWLSQEAWRANARDFVEDDFLHEEAVFGALDLSCLKDLTAFVMLAYRPDGSFRMKHYAWVPEETVRERTKLEDPRYAQWVAAGELRTTKGHTIDMKQVRGEIAELCQRYNVQLVAVDKWNALDAITYLEDEGIETFGWAQTIRSYNLPTKEFERAVIDGRMEHDGNDMLAWCVENTKLWRDDLTDNCRPIKAHQDKRIDPVICGVMALGTAIAHSAQRSSVAMI